MRFLEVFSRPAALRMASMLNSLLIDRRNHLPDATTFPILPAKSSSPTFRRTPAARRLFQTAKPSRSAKPATESPQPRLPTTSRSTNSRRSPFRLPSPRQPQPTQLDLPRHEHDQRAGAFAGTESHSPPTRLRRGHGGAAESPRHEHERKSRDEREYQSQCHQQEEETQHRQSGGRRWRRTGNQRHRPWWWQQGQTQSAHRRQETESGELIRPKSSRSLMNISWLFAVVLPSPWVVGCGYIVRSVRSGQVNSGQVRSGLYSARRCRISPRTSAEGVRGSTHRRFGYIRVGVRFPVLVMFIHGFPQTYLWPRILCISRPSLSCVRLFSIRHLCFVPRARHVGGGRAASVQ